ERRGSGRALHLCAGERGSADPGRRHCRARRRHRPGVPQWLRLPRPSRRPDAVRRHGGPAQRSAGLAPVRGGARRRPVVAARAAAASARRDVQLKSEEFNMTTDVVIVSTASTGLAKSWKGAFNMTYGATLAAHSIEHAVKRAGIDPAEVEDVILGAAALE